MTVMGMPDSWNIQVAVGYGRVLPSSIPGGAWVSIKGQVQRGSIMRGTNHELQLPDAGELLLTLDNSTGVLMPNNAAGWGVNASSIWPSGAGLIMTPIRAQAVIGGTTYPRFFGYIDSWGPSDYSNTGWREIECSAYDWMKQATDCYMPASYLTAEYLLSNPVFIYSCNDSSTAKMTNKSVQFMNYTALDSSPNKNNGTFGAVADNYLGTSTGQGPLPLINLQANTIKCSLNGRATTSSGAMTFNILCNLKDVAGIGSSAPMHIASCYQAGTGGWIISAYYNNSTAKWYPQLTLWNGSSSHTTQIKIPFAIDVDQMLTLTHSAGTYTLYFNGGTAGAAATAALGYGGAGTGAQASLSGTYCSVPNQPIYIMGSSASTSNNLIPSTYSMWYGAVGDIFLGSSAVSANTVSNWWKLVYPVPRDTGQWIQQQILQVIPTGVLNTDYIADTGTSLVVEPEPSLTESTSVRSAIEDTVHDEVGQFWVDPNGRPVFRNRSWTSVNNTPAAFFGVGSGFIPIKSAKPENTTQDLWTHISGTRASSNPIVIASAAATSVAHRTGGFGTKTYHYPSNFNQTTDAEVQNILSWVINRYDYETTRVAEIVCKPWVNKMFTSSAPWATLYGLDLWSTVIVSLPAGPSIPGVLTVACLVEGIKDDFDFQSGDYTITLSTAPAWNVSNPLIYLIPGSYSIGLYPLAG